MKKLALAAAIASFASVGHAYDLGPFDDLIVFGDSFSDPGNMSALTGGTRPNTTTLPDGSVAYPNGMWTDGFTWAHKLGATFDSGRNYAHGGATSNMDVPVVLDLAEQVDAYTPPADLGDNPVAAIFIGGNDYLQFIENDLAAIGDLTTTDGQLAVGAYLASDEGMAAGGNLIQGTVNGIFGTPATATEPAKPGAIDLLTAKGLTEFVVFGLPDIGTQPGLPASFAGFLTSVSENYNALLKGTLEFYNAATDASNVSFLDIAAVLEPLFGDGSPFTIFDRPCVLQDLEFNVISVCDNPEDHIFYDSVHPTDRVHDFVAAAFVDHVTPIPLPAGAPLLLVALGAMGVAARRRVAAGTH